MIAVLTYEQWLVENATFAAEYNEGTLREYYEMWLLEVNQENESQAVLSFDDWAIEYAEQLADAGCDEAAKKMYYQEYLDYQRAYRGGYDL